MNLRSSGSTRSAEKAATSNPKSAHGRVFTEQHEIQLLKAFKLSIRKDPLSTPSFSFAHFTPSQISSKLKRLKQKYHKMAKSKSLIKTPQDRKIYLLSRKIWAKQHGITTAQNAHNFNPPNRDTSEVIILEDGLDFSNENFSGDHSKSGKTEVDLENFPFLLEAISDEVKGIGWLYFEGLKSLGEEKLKELNDMWMVLSMQNAEIETEKSLLLQNQFILVADATRKM